MSNPTKRVAPYWYPSGYERSTLGCAVCHRPISTARQYCSQACRSWAYRVRKRRINSQGDILDGLMDIARTLEELEALASERSDNRLANTLKRIRGEVDEVVYKRLAKALGARQSQ